MSNSRRKFLQQLAASTAWAGIALGAKGIGLDHGPDPQASLASRLAASDGDEAFWAELRKEFNFPKIPYFNAGTLGLVPKVVLETINAEVEQIAAGRNIADGKPREAVARLLNAPVEGICITHNTTESINIAASGLRLRKGDEVILTDQEHVGNALPWLNQARLRGIRIKVLSPAPTAAENLQRINDLLSRRTRVLALPHVNCTIGQALPVKEISQLAREKGILTVWDGAHGPGMLFPDMAEIDCDIYATCGHKWVCGPAGTGMLYVRPDLLPKVEAQMIGAYSDTGWEISQSKQELKALVPTAHRYDYGTQSAALLSGLEAAVNFMDFIGYQKIQKRVLALSTYLFTKLQEKDYVEMLSPTEESSRSAMIGFRIKGKTLKDIDASEFIHQFRIRMVPESNLNSLRISTHIYNSHAELDAFLLALDNYMAI